MKRFSVLLVLVLMEVVLLVSCSENSVVSDTSLEILVNQDEGIRTLMPSASLMDVNGYSVSGTGPGGAAFGPVFSTANRMVVEGILPGRWTITGHALNSDENELAFGSDEYEITRGSNQISLVLDGMRGNGVLDLVFRWSVDVSTDDVISILVELEDDKGNVVKRTKDAQRTAGNAGLTVTLPAGCHILTASVSDSVSTLGVGATEAVRIVENTRTEGVVDLRGSLSATGDLVMTIENRVGTPMTFILDYGPKAPSAGQSLVMNAMAVHVPSGVKSNELFYQWYVDGVIVKLGYDSSYTTVAQSGRHRYDVVVKSPIEGTLCSASAMITVP